MNGRGFNRVNLEQVRFIEEQLFETKQALFAATTVRQIKFLQSKLNYLKQQAKKLESE
jgi:hypothetical protein